MFDFLASVIVDGIFFGPWTVARVLLALLALACVAVLLVFVFGGR